MIMTKTRQKIRLEIGMNERNMSTSSDLHSLNMFGQRSKVNQHSVSRMSAE